MNREDIIKLLGDDWDRLDGQIRSALGSDIPLLNSVNESIISNSGKQLRPMLTLLVARACGRSADDSIRFAAAAELLHNATLLHDDVADQSSIRRGKPTLASLLGPSPAVLVGDFWLSKAVSLVLASTRRTEATTLFAGTLSDLAEGEMLQLQKAENADTTEADYLRIVFCKTASLFRTACLSGALSADAPRELYEAAGRYGAATGIAFQIRDDIFDYLDEPAIGKPVGLDLRERKITLPLLGALQNAPEEARIRAMVRDIPEHPEHCAAIRSFVTERGGIGYASRRLADYVSEALAALELFPPSPYKDVLAELARYNAIRQS